MVVDSEAGVVRKGGGAQGREDRGVYYSTIFSPFYRSQIPFSASGTVFEETCPCGRWVYDATSHGTST